MLTSVKKKREAKVVIMGLKLLIAFCFVKFSRVNRTQRFKLFYSINFFSVNETLKIIK